LYTKLQSFKPSQVREKPPKTSHIKAKNQHGWFMACFSWFPSNLGSFS